MTGNRQAACFIIEDKEAVRTRGRFGTKGGISLAWHHIRYYSEALRMPTAMEVLVPQQGKPVATLYLLHDMGDDHTAWFRRTSVERYAAKLPLAVVMPAGHLGWYTDMVYGKHYFAFVAKELPALCERLFPLSGGREHRFIAGAGMGGYGAIKAGLLAADTFCAAASFSGALDVSNVYDSLDPRLAADIFGPKEQLPGSGNDLFAAAERLAAQSERSRPEFYMWCESGSPLQTDNVRFRDRLLQLGLSVSYEELQENQGWAGWDMALQRLLAQLPLPASGQ
jgi:S-formylglutathione hydrolase FrmB